MNFVVGKAKDDEPEVKQPKGAGIVPKLHFRWILSGPSKSGKSNLAKWSLDNYYAGSTKGKSFFDKIYLLSPTAHIDFMWSNLAGLDHKNRISHPTPEHLTKILESQIKKIAGSANESALKNISAATLAKKKTSCPSILVIFDDAIAESKLINSSAFLKIFIQGRHYNISSMVMTQSYMRVPRSVRLQATHVSMFPTRTSEIDRLFIEFGGKTLSKKEFHEMVAYATTPQPGDEYPFLHLDAFASEEVKYRRNFTNTLQLRSKQNNNIHSDNAGPKQKRRRRQKTIPNEEEVKTGDGL